MPLPATPVQLSLHSTWVSCWLKAIWTRPPFKELFLSGCASYCSSFDFAKVLEELRIKKTRLSFEIRSKWLFWSCLSNAKYWNILSLIFTVVHLSGRLKGRWLQTCPVGWHSGGVSLFICADHPPVIITQMITSFCAMSSYTSVGALLSHSPKLWPWVYKAL